MKLSIIIPMYNAEKYIGECLDSILNSDLPKDCYEVIIINDGSKDRGPEIAQEYANGHENFLYLTQENQGQSVARNYGIRVARGEYVWFVDADDTIDCSLLSIFHELNSHQEVDIFAFQLKEVTEQGVFVGLECTQANVTHEQIITGRDAIVSGYNPSSVCALLVRKKMMTDNNLFFKEGITHQDVELSYRLFINAKHVIFTNHTPYIYILHPCSTSQSVNPQKKIKYLKDDIVVYHSFKYLSEQVADDVLLSGVISNRAQNVLFSMVYSLWTHKKEWKPLGINHAVITEMKKSNLYPLKGPFDSWKKRIASIFLNIEAFIS